MTVKGQDWASYQSNSPSTSGLAFAFIKATEGTSYINPRMTSQTKKARAGGLVVGFYHFLHPGSIAAQAAYFVDRCDSVQGDVLACDWESSQSGRASCAEKDQFLAEVKRLRPTHRVILYCNKDFWQNHDTTSQAGDGLWIADYVTAGKPRISAPWLFHQYTSSPIDTNLGQFKDRTALKAWAGGGAATPPAPPKPPAAPKLEPFPGAAWFKTGRRSPIVAAMHARLVAVGCNRYQSTANKDVIGGGDKASYEAFQRSIGLKGADATWPPGPTSWAALKVPNV